MNNTDNYFLFYALNNVLQTSVLNLQISQQWIRQFSSNKFFQTTNFYTYFCNKIMFLRKKNIKALICVFLTKRISLETQDGYSFENGISFIKVVVTIFRFSAIIGFGDGLIKIWSNEKVQVRRKMIQSRDKWKKKASIKIFPHFQIFQNQYICIFFCYESYLCLNNDFAMDIEFNRIRLDETFAEWYKTKTGKNKTWRKKSLINNTKKKINTAREQRIYTFDKITCYWNWRTVWKCMKNKGGSSWWWNNLLLLHI